MAQDVRFEMVSGLVLKCKGGYSQKERENIDFESSKTWSGPHITEQV